MVFDPCSHLQRSDKWYLGCGGAALWAPPFPRHLDRPGFWDRAHWYRYPLEPVFAIALLDERGREIRLQPRERRWRPGELEQTYHAPDGLGLVETRVVTPDDCLASHLRLENGSGQPRRLRVAVWTCQPGHGLESAEVQAVWLVFSRRPTLWDLPTPSNHLALGLGVDFSLAPTTPFLVSAEHGVPGPDWSLSPLCELAAGGREGVPLHPYDPSHPPPFVYLAALAEIDLAPGQYRLLTCAAALGLVQGETVARLGACLSSDPVAATRRSWQEYFASVPSFRCSDSYLETAYWYRWYGLRLLTVDRSGLNYDHPVVCEGIDSFRAPISYSAQCHLREVRWLRSPTLGQGILRTFASHQRSDGSLPGYIPPLGELPHTFYHADWGGAALALHQVHPDPAFLAELYPALARYAEYLRRERDPAGSGLCEVWNHYETGQEYMSRYLFADPTADRENWGSVFRLYGVDASVYAYQTYRALAELARQLERSAEAERWRLAADRAAEAIRATLWHPELGFFVDALPGSLARSEARAALGFYPFMSDLAQPRHLPAFARLRDPAQFWTPFPVPSTSADDPLFSAEGIWRGVRRNCPWNGRVWPMTNSHLAEALVNAAETLDSDLLPLAAGFLHRTVRLLFFDQDPARPNCFEHYHPYSGQPSAYRGIDDYQHSWLVDLIIRFVCGLRPDGPELQVRPLPMGLAWFELEGAPWRGHAVSIAWKEGQGLRVWVDGVLKAERPSLEACVLSL